MKHVYINCAAAMVRQVADRSHKEGTDTADAEPRESACAGAASAVPDDFRSAFADVSGRRGSGGTFGSYKGGDGGADFDMRGVGTCTGGDGGADFDMTGANFLEGATDGGTPGAADKRA